ncbi:metallophosphoesterase [uncultured Georgenia sp.]|uniref:metallophosphoesterase family protein n=1 Tax=uncultured Georgenia sp. TaxID=378209 RepID=UPI0026155C7D|nr:metallophosphoesterase [uncultured Georgenia sp.]HLV03859.1 metallophosphoesterase [Actinomycetaceae bacterium]
MAREDDDGARPAARERRWRWEWWHRQTTATRRTIRTTLTLLVTGLVSAVFGVLTAATDSSLGPHAAHYAVTPQHEIVVDLGPLGAVLLDSPLPWPLGVDVTVQEIPMELTAVQPSPVTGLAGDLAAYAQLVSHPEAAVAEAAGALVRDALGRAVLTWSGLLVVIAGGRFASRGLLRRELAAAVTRPGVRPLVGVVVLSLVAVPVAGVVADRPAEGTTIRALAGTPMEDLRMTGRMAQLIDTYGGYLVEAYEENEAFYATVTANLEAAYAESRSPLRPPGIPIVSPAPTDPADDDTGPGGADQPGPPSPGPVDGPSPDGDPGPGPTDDAVPGAGMPLPARVEPTPRPRVEPVTFLHVSDLHCNVGMAAVIATAVRLSGAQAVLDTGDTVMSGTSVESYCVNAFAGAVPPDVPIVVSTGNHDSVTTAEQMRDAGYVVLDGEVVEVAGVHLLGDTDPTLTSLGEGTRPEREETVPEMGERLAQTACAADRVDLLLVHNPSAALPALDRGCVRLALSGHWHRREGPEVLGSGTRYVGASTAGASGGATIGPLNGPAEMTVLRVDATTGRPLDYRVITIGTDAEVDLGRWYSFPRPADEAAPSGDTGDREPTEEPTDADASAGTER